MPASIEERIDEHLRNIGNIGRDPDGGWSRLAFTSQEQEVHNYAGSELQQQGYIIKTDAFGNLIAAKNGISTSRKKVMFGTHLDTVLNGGNYDGVVGFITAIEAVKLAEQVKCSHLDYGVDIVIFRAEESTRFKRGCLGSSAAFGLLSQQDLTQLNDNGVTLTHEIIDHGGDIARIGDVLLNPKDYDGYFETHIEQACVLERDNIPVGVVTSIRAAERRQFITNSMKIAANAIVKIERIAKKYAEVGDLVATVGKLEAQDNNKTQLITGANSINTISGNITFLVKQIDGDLTQLYQDVADQRGVIYNIKQTRSGYEVNVTGVAAHSGGTPMGEKYRKDSLVAASEMILLTSASWIEPNAKITFYIDVRSNDETYRNAAMREIIEKTRNQNLFISDPTEKSKPVTSLDLNLQDRLKQSAQRLDIKTMYLPSGAGHDAMKAAEAGIPTAMLFVPSKNGLSHNPLEFTETKHIAQATIILADYLTKR